MLSFFLLRERVHDFNSKKRKKVFLELQGRPVWLRAAEKFVGRKDVAQTIIAVSPDDLEWFKEKFRPNLAFLDIQIVAGGAERGDTVLNCLAQVKSDVEYVAIHDAARPLMSSLWIDQIFQAAQAKPAVIPAIPISSTVKRANQTQTIEETVSREGLWLAQTPQVFQRELLLEAFAKRGELQHTDEAQLVEQLGEPVTIVPGWPMNLKITNADDWLLAKALVNHIPQDQGLPSLHPFADEQPGFFK